MGWYAHMPRGSKSGTPSCLFSPFQDRLIRVGIKNNAESKPMSRSLTVVQYLLPCQCGRKIPVDTTKAGRTLKCECDAQLEVPTLGGLKKLEPAAQSKHAPSAATWGPRQRVLLAGILICVTGLGIAGFFWRDRPLPPPHELRIERIPKHVEGLTLMQTMELWAALEHGLPEGLGIEDQAYRMARQAYIRRTGVALFIAVAGALVMVISLFIPKKRRRPIRA